MSPFSQQSAWIVAILVLFASTITCRSNKDPVSELMAELEEAAEAREPSTAAYDFDLRLVQEDDLLKVKKAFWRNTSTF